MAAPITALGFVPIHVDIHDGVCECIEIQILTAREANPVSRCKAASLRIVVTVPVVMQPRLRVVVLAGE